MCSVVAFILASTGCDEPLALKLLVRLAINMGMGKNWRFGMDGLYGALREKIANDQREISDKFADAGVELKDFAEGWFSTLLSGRSILDERSLTLVWDLYFISGFPVLIEACCAILEGLKGLISTARGKEELLRILERPIENNAGSFYDVIKDRVSSV